MRRTTSHCMALYLPQASQQLQGILEFVSNCFRFLTGCATDPAPPQPPQHHFELPSSQTFGSIAVRRQRTGSTRHLTKRLTTSRQSSTQRTFGVWRTNFQCRFDSFPLFHFLSSLWIKLSLSNFPSLQHNTAKSTRQPLQKLRMFSKMFSAPGGGDAAFR